MKLIKRSTIPASYCDADVKLSPVGAFQIIEDTVTEMMGELKIDGLVCMKKYHAMWIYVRNRIEFGTPVFWNEEYTVECYISMIGRAKMNIDTVLKKKDGACSFVSRLELCAVDLDTMKLRKTETVGLDGSIEAEEAEYQVIYDRTRFVPVKLLDTVTVRSSDIDYCHHTNNISYIRYLINQWSVEDLSKKPVRAIEVQYAGQTHEGDTLEVHSCGNDEPSGKECYMISHDEKPVLNCLVIR